MLYCKAQQKTDSDIEKELNGLHFITKAVRDSVNKLMKKYVKRKLRKQIFNP
jgi:hypothetical protein